MRIVKMETPLAEKVEKLLKENGDYCPCRLQKTPDTKCMCKEFREQDEGICHCGLYKKEKNVYDYIEEEQKRQDNTIELIASENFTSEAIRDVMSSCFINKYAEGYPELDRVSGRSGRYYGGCQVVDKLEEYCCLKWRKVFNTDYHVNVQPHSGTNANFSAYMAVLNPGDVVLSMSLDNGSHLSHLSPVNLSGKIYQRVEYGVDENGFIDYDDIDLKIRQYHPRLILAGASAYSRAIDFKRIKEIIEAISLEDFIERNEDYHPYFMVDMAHIAGLVAAGLHPTPFGVADIITTTTQKTLRGPRGGLIFCKPNLAKTIDGAVFPGTQGGPHMNTIAAKAICAEEALLPSFKDYIGRVVYNTRVMCEEFRKMGYKIVTGGTDNHLFLIDLTENYPDLSGRDVQNELDRHNITLNKNCVPNEKRSPVRASGLRIGCAAMTTKGWRSTNFIQVAHQIDDIIRNLNKKRNLKKIEINDIIIV